MFDMRESSICKSTIDLAGLLTNT